MITCLSSEKMERCPSDVTVLSTHPPTAGWHRVVVFVEGYSPRKPVSRTEVATLLLIAADMVMCHRCGSHNGIVTRNASSGKETSRTFWL